jgi:hypothetical protein
MKGGENMKNIWIMVMVVGLVMGMSVSAPTNVSAQEEAVVAETTASVVTGAIVAVDLENSTITIETAATEEGQAAVQTVVVIDDATVIAKGEEVVSKDGLTVGSNVTVEYVTDEAGANVAQNISVM